VSIPFSLLCLKILTDFHKSATFRPNILYYLNAIFTFGKQTKDNFINRKFQCRPTYSFTHLRVRFSFIESWGRSPRRTRKNSRSTAISGSSVGSTPRRDQVSSVIQSRHLVLGRPLGRFPRGCRL